MKVQRSLIRRATEVALGGALLLGMAAHAESPGAQSQGLGQGFWTAQGQVGPGHPQGAPMPGSGAGHWVPIRIYGWPSDLLGMPAPQGTRGIPGLPLCQGTSSEDGTWVWIPRSKGTEGVTTKGAESAARVEGPGDHRGGASAGSPPH